MSRIPSPDEILAWLRENPGQTGKREIARAFGLKGQAKVELKRVLADMKHAGTIEKRRTRVRPQGELPPVLVLKVTGPDSAGELWAEPVEWEVEGERPRILIRTRRDDPGARRRRPAARADDRARGSCAAGGADHPPHRDGTAPRPRHLP